MTPSPKSPSPKPAAAEPATGPAAMAEPAPESGAAPAVNEFAQLSYEEARDALSDVVRRLESGAQTLEESLALWERGEALARHCEQWLAGAQARLDVHQGSAQSSPAEPAT